MNTNLASILRQADLLTHEQEQMVVSSVLNDNKSVLVACVDAGFLTSQDLLQHLCHLFALPQAHLEHYGYAEVCQQLGLRDLITNHQVLPLQVDNHGVLIAVSDPTNTSVEDDFRFATGKQIELILADCKELEGAIRRLYGRSVNSESAQGKDITQDELANLVEVGSDEIQETEDLSQDEAPVSRFINQILLDAVRKGASDIHFEPYEDIYRVRLRCDGILIETNRPAPHLGRRLAARIKILSKLDIAERRLPQDGRIKIRLNPATAIDMRVSTLPTLWGEKIVLRLLDSSAANLNIDKLGYSDAQKKLYLDALQQPQGMILMTGPTGSGKTVSLYTGLRILNSPDKNISTAEDPVEINLTGINQVQVKPKIGFTFAAALRAFLRQDPDVVMVGEIRDLETAEIAIKAAQTGHLVLSTLHTNSSSETVVRLSNMGIEAFNLASSLTLIIAQRLARRLCKHCKKTDNFPEALRSKFNIPNDVVIYQATKQGCPECTGGYSGRVGIYEVMPFSTELANAVIKKASANDIEMIAVKQGMSTLRQSGIDNLKQGVTSFAELQRVLYF
ncbi:MULTISPECIES: type IV-A pilus assembly ATPase PilB [Vibrio]|uniref:Type IV-A pilus assembly ATPase PilB n=1 Tax=Vibrio casei TaxID=673372 RepID=A0A368LKX6_9VIBR|nr:MULTISPECIES: type IV-A pilus assembly ATPase PilB [Vibrio]RCS72507.1 type IV-A pilus assembly ATPase PilB [Vibrio casei]SJN36307.1 Type IV fimbrial assembly, ATPase PilB [Vibrio casei]HBV75150.1 type IV-A pilus assembly ATPase PilB [Vibrio sp.]